MRHLHSDHTVGYVGRKVQLEVYGPKGIKAMTEHTLRPTALTSKRALIQTRAAIRVRLHAKCEFHRATMLFLEGTERAFASTLWMRKRARSQLGGKVKTRERKDLSSKISDPTRSGDKKQIPHPPEGGGRNTRAGSG